MGRIRAAFQVSGDNICKPMRLDVLCRAPKCQRPFEQFTSELLGLLCLLQSSWCLPVVTRPNFKACAWSTCYCCSLLHVAILLTLVLQHQVNLLDPFFAGGCGLVPGGAPFSQLNKGVKDAVVESTGLGCTSIYDKNMQEGKLTCLIQSDTGLYGCPHSIKKPPPHPVSKDFCRMW